MNLTEFQFNYKTAGTYVLLKTLSRVRVLVCGLSRSELLKEVLSEYIDSLKKIHMALKKELATREHVPNKKERKVIRQNKAKK